MCVCVFNIVKIFFIELFYIIIIMNSPFLYLFLHIRKRLYIFYLLLSCSLIHKVNETHLV